jgi:hypothetical protein
MFLFCLVFVGILVETYFNHTYFLSGKALWYTAKKLNEKEKIVNRLRSGAGRLFAIGRQSIRKPTSNINKKKNNGGKRGNKSDPIVWSSNVSSSNGPAWKNESDVSSIALGEKCLAQPSASAVRHLDPSTGKYYYHDTVTKETWWEEDSTLLTRWTLPRFTLCWTLPVLNLIRAIYICPGR